MGQQALACRYEAAIEQQSALQDVYTQIAKLLHCKADEIAIMQSATAAWTQAETIPSQSPHPFLHPLLSSQISFLAQSSDLCQILCNLIWGKIVKFVLEA